ncbi:hypothetical protein [Methanobacterium ferruginis]|uniref:hypothetical protein n=1 Tax=Methanobacterium ferruginis TaxID=710191 RepID=UPI002572F069|nr:hypothetical protein [Methanobacterium ferruginis]
MNIDDIDKFINDFIKPLCNQICECVQELTKLYNEIRPEILNNYSKKFIERYSEEKKDKYKLNPAKNDDKDVPKKIMEENDKKTKFSFRITSKPGEPNFWDLLNASTITGYPIEVAGDRISNIKLDKNQLPDELKDGKISGLKLIPGLVKLNIRVTNRNKGFDNLLFRAVERNEVFKFSTEDRNLPYLFEFSFKIEPNNTSNIKEPNFKFEIKPPVNAIELFKWEEFMRALKDKQSIRLIDPKTGKVIVGGDGIEQDFQLGNENWYNLIKKLSYIQKKSNQIIEIPKDYDLTWDDEYAVDHTYELLNTGKTEMKVNNVAFSLKVVNAKEMIQFMLDKKIVPLNVTIPNYYAEIIGKRIELGPVNVHSPSYTIFQQEELLSRIKDNDDMESVSVKVIPENEKINLKRS